MKKIALLLLMFVAFQASAQEFHFLPKIGLNLANMTNTEGSMKPGLNVGFAAEFPINPQFAIEPGIYYSMQGVKESESGVSGKIKNDYINIPIYAKAYLYKGFYAFAGPQFGFNVGSGHFGDYDIKDCNTTFNVGAGVKLISHLQIGVNYNFSINKVAKYEEEGKKYDMKKNTWQVSLAYLF